MEDNIPLGTYKIVYFLENNPKILNAKFFDSKEKVVSFVSNRKLSDYLITKLVERVPNTEEFVWEIEAGEKDGLGKDFQSGYKLYKAMNSPEQRLLTYGIGLLGGVGAYYISKKFVSVPLVNVSIGILTSMLAVNGYLKIKQLI